MKTTVGIVICIVLLMDIYCRVRMAVLDDEELEDEQAIIEIILLALMGIGIFLSF